MPIIKQECYTIECDFCGDEYENGDGVVYHWPVSSGVDIWSDDWRIWYDAEKQEHVWCPDCEPNCVCGHGFVEHDCGDADCEEEVTNGPGEPATACDCVSFKLPVEADA